MKVALFSSIEGCHFKKAALLFAVSVKTPLRVAMRAQGGHKVAMRKVARTRLSPHRSCGQSRVPQPHQHLLQLLLPEHASSFLYIGSKPVHWETQTHFRTSCSCPTMPVQLTIEEQDLVDKMVRKEKKSGMDAVRAINDQRRKQRIELADKTTIYRFINGETHRRGRPETRGCKRVLTQADVRRLDKTRLRLIKKAEGGRCVTHHDAHPAATRAAGSERLAGGLSPGVFARLAGGRPGRPIGRPGRPIARPPTRAPRPESTFRSPNRI